MKAVIRAISSYKPVNLFIAFSSIRNVVQPLRGMAPIFRQALIVGWFQSSAEYLYFIAVL
jgi:hypothetical protein